MRTWLALSLSLTGMAAAHQPAGAEVIVVAAQGPSAATYRIGSSLPDGASITLREHDQLTLLSQIGGGTRQLRGPGVFSATPGAPIADAPEPPAPQRRTKLGGVRSIGGGGALSFAEGQ